MSTPHDLPHVPHLPHVFRPVQVGTLSLDHRLVVPPHGGGNGNLLGSEAEFEQHCALWLAKADGGMQWLGGGPNFVRNPLPIGFEPTGVGAHGPGFFRDPRYPERIGEFARRLHAAGADVVAVVTGATPRIPLIPGVDGQHVHTAAAALCGEAELGHRIAVIAEDDGPAPLSVSDHLAGLGHAITLVYQSTAPSPLLGKYSNGGMLVRLVDGGVMFEPMARLVGIHDGGLQLASSYGDRRWSLDGIDSVVLVAGAIPDDRLYRVLTAEHPAVHLLGDAFAPRRMVFATRQAFALAQTLL